MVVVAATLARADVTYNVFPAAMNPNCDPAGKKMSDGHSLGAKPAGFCHELGKGKAAWDTRWGQSRQAFATTRSWAKARL